jgi:(3S)-malyl-CoA thioesterase
MAQPILRSCRSLLYLPAANPRVVEKARDLPADMIILDCEDAVKLGDKEAARTAAVAAAQAGYGGRPVAIRINAAGTSWHEEDIAAVRDSRADYILIPKVERPVDAEVVAEATGKPVLAMIETPQAVLAAPSIAAATAGLVAGTNDLAAALGIPPAAGREGLMHALQAIVMAARAARVAVFDGVCNRLDDENELERQCREGRSFGFDGKTLIHPNQIDIANRLFGPSDEEVEAARRLIEASTGGAERFEGQMIEDLHVAEARAVLARAQR